jgi:hypothetical protein
MGCYILLKLKSIRLLFLHSYYATQLFGSYPFWLWERALIAFFVWAILGIFPSIFFPPMNNKWTRYIGDWCDCRHSDQLAEDDIFRVNPLAFSSDIAYTVHLIPIERIWRTHYYSCWRISIALYRFRRRIEFSTLVSLALFSLSLSSTSCAPDFTLSYLPPPVPVFRYCRVLGLSIQFLFSILCDVLLFLFLSNR